MRAERKTASFSCRTGKKSLFYMTKILIVEDEKSLAELYRDKFKEAHYQVFLAFSAEEALEYLKKARPDLILLDILLPRSNGISFLKKLRGLKNVCDVPVIAFSNYDEPETKKIAFDLGVKDYLIKTQYTPEELLKEVKGYLKELDKK